jgi:ribokinase
VGGANMEGWAAGVESDDLELIRQAGVLLLQREIPDWVNIQAAQVLLQLFVGFGTQIVII